jgi:predicted DNA-binding protein
MANTKTASIRLTDDQLANLDKQAAKEGRSRNYIVKRLIEQAFAQIPGLEVVSMKQHEDVLVVKGSEPRSVHAVPKGVKR